MPIDQSGKRRECTTDEKIEVIKLHAEGHTYHEIAEKTSVSRSQAQKIVSDFDKNGTIETTQRTGAPPKLNKRDKRHIFRLVEKEPEATIEEITADSFLNVCPRTVGRALRQNGYYVRLARKNPWLNQQMRRTRLTWCRKKKHWTKEDWRRKAYTDECKVELGQGGGRKRVRRKSNTAYKEHYLEPTFCTQRTSAMFWGAYTYGSHTPLISVRKRTIEEKTKETDKLGMNAPQYCHEIMEPHLVPFVKEAERSGEEYMTIEDQHPAHKSGLAKLTRLQHGIKRVPWCGNSPDLNPIENVWYALKRRLKMRWRNPHKRPHSAEELIEAAKEEWEKINWRHMEKFIDSMPARIAMVIKRRGGTTRW